MATDWEATFRKWSKPSSDFEQQKMERAVSEIQRAVATSPLNRFNMRVFAQGSYRNNTNVRRESDVDVCVLNQSYFFYDFQAEGITEVTAGISKGSNYSFYEYRREVGAALRNHFGASAVTAGSKAFDIKETATRVDADAVPCFNYRLYTGKDSTGRPRYIQPIGTAFEPAGGRRIHNWPEQHFTNGNAKNAATVHRFKFMVRALKRLRYYMEDQEVGAARDVPSFLVECLVYNVPNNYFGHAEYAKDMREVLAHAFNATLSDDRCDKWVEVNGIEALFHWTQPWSRADAHAFLSAAWDFVGYT